MLVVSGFIFIFFAGVLIGVAYFVYQRKLRRAKAIERGLKMVPVLIHLPPASADTAGSGRDMREVMREKTAQAEILYNLIAGTAVEGFKSKFYGQRHIGLELVAAHGLIHFYVAVPVVMVSVVERAIQTAYPGARLEEVEDHNIFNQEGRLAATMGGELVLKSSSAYPISTYRELDRDPLEAIITALSTMNANDGAALQIMIRPAYIGWNKSSVSLADKLRNGKSGKSGFRPSELLQALAKPPSSQDGKEKPQKQLTGLEQSVIDRIESKTNLPGFEVLVRLVVSTQSVGSSQKLLRDLANAFSLFEAPGLNGFKFLSALDVQGLVTAFILRFFPPEMRSNILNSSELATIFHLPDAQFVPTANVERQSSREVDGPTTIPSKGLMFGYNEFRGVKKAIRLSNEDRRRHTYILGQTGTGKSTMLENLAVQDMLAGNGFAFIDPHGDTAEKLLSLVPKERAEDVIYFNPADTEFPLGLNLFEFDRPEQKDFLVQETIGMLYKLYDPGHTGIIGPRYEHWYRNAALTLMSDPNGATFIEIPKVFTDTEYLKQKFRHLKDPTVMDFWVKEMGQTSDYHKSEMLGWFVSKFGAFQNNEMMRNIIGQTKSSFNLREVMDNKKILIVNLSKGRIGELNSQLLGMMFVIKFQAAAMSRADMPENQRQDFALYVDEFQNFSTDSFASILSEARKYRLNLIVANQFIGQLTNEIRDAVFGNIGTIIAHRMGPEDAEFMVRQFSPVFDSRDLVNIPNYHSAMRLMIGGLPSQPFTMGNLPALGNVNAELGLAIKQLSAAKFGQAKSQVEFDITRRMGGSSAITTPAPRVSPAAPVESTVASVDTEPAASSIDTARLKNDNSVQTGAPAQLNTVEPISRDSAIISSDSTDNGKEETVVNNNHLSIQDIVGGKTAVNPQDSNKPSRSADEAVAAVLAAASKREAELASGKTPTPLPVAPQGTDDATVPSSAVTEIPIVHSETPQANSSETPTTTEPITSAQNIVAPVMHPAVAAVEHRIDTLLSESLLPQNERSTAHIEITEHNTPSATGHHRLASVPLPSNSDDDQAETSTPHDDGYVTTHSSNHRVILPLEEIRPASSVVAQGLKELATPVEAVATKSSAHDSNRMHEIASVNLLPGTMPEILGAIPEKTIYKDAIASGETSVKVDQHKDIRDDAALPLLSDTKNEKLNQITLPEPQPVQPNVQVQAIKDAEPLPDARRETVMPAAEVRDNDAISYEKIIEGTEQTDTTTAKPIKALSDQEAAALAQAAAESAERAVEAIKPPEKIVPVEPKQLPQSPIISAAPPPVGGSLIMPNMDIQHEASAAPRRKLQRPEILAKGEVFVDEAGNVIIGE